MVNWRSGVIVLVLMSCGGPSPAAPTVRDRDMEGRPLHDAAGRPINYTRDGRAVYGRPRVSFEVAQPSLAPPPSARPAAPAASRVRVVNPLLMRDDATIGSHAQMLGVTGVRAWDADDDGMPEIYVGHTMMFYAVDFEPSTGRYPQRHFNETPAGGSFGGGGVVELRVGDLSGTGRHMVVLTDAGELQLYDAVSGAYLSSQTVLGAATGLALGDFDAAPGLEAAVISGKALATYRMGAPAPLWTQLIGGVYVAVGNVDGDAPVEIIVATGTATPGYVIDSGTQAVQWTYPTGFGELVDAGDVDADGKDEIVACETWGDCMVMDADTQTLKWSLYNFNTSALRVADMDGDGVKEVVIGDRQWGEVHFHDGVSGALLQAIPNPTHSIAGLDVADVDGDCQLEVVWGGGFTIDLLDRMFVADIATGALEHESYEDDGPMYALAVGDVDGDGQSEVVRASDRSDAGFDGALVFVSDLHHRRDEYIPTSATTDGRLPTRGMALAQLDGDAALEYVMNDSSGSSGRVSAFDGVTHARQWTSSAWLDERVTALAVGDLDGDLVPDVLVGTGKASDEADGVFLRVLRGTDGALLWQSPNLATTTPYVEDVRVADADGDATVELVAATNGEGIRVYSGLSGTLEWSLPLADVTSLDVGDADTDADLDLVVGDASGTIRAFDGATKATVLTAAVGTSSIWAVRVGDVDGDAINEVVYTEDVGIDLSQAGILDVPTQTVLWTSAPLPGAAGTASSLLVADADDDGLTEILVATSHAIRTFEHASVVPDVSPPTWGGGAGVQAVTSLPSSCCPALDVAWGLADDAASPPVAYHVYRGTSPSFVPGSTNLVAETGLTSFRDTRVAPGTFYYVVRAVDRVGNVDGNLIHIGATTAGVPAEVSASPSPTPMLVRKGAGTNLVFSFEDIGPSAAVYNLYEGLLPSFYSHTGVACGITPTPVGGHLETTFTPNQHDRYYLITASNSCGESTSGYDSQGVERPSAPLNCP